MSLLLTSHVTYPSSSQPEPTWDHRCFFPCKSFVKVQVSCTQTVTNSMFRTFLMLIFVAEACKHQHLCGPWQKPVVWIQPLSISSEMTDLFETQSLFGWRDVEPFSYFNFVTQVRTNCTVTFLFNCNHAVHGWSDLIQTVLPNTFAFEKVPQTLKFKLFLYVLVFPFLDHASL